MVAVNASQNDRRAFAAELLRLARSQGLPPSSIVVTDTGFDVPQALATAFSPATARSGAATADARDTIEELAAGAVFRPAAPPAVAAPTAPGGVYSQAEAASAVAAINALRAALRDVGIIA